MAEILASERWLWGFGGFLNALLIFFLFYRKNYRVFPFFTVYVVMNLLQSVIVFEAYRIWRFSSATSMGIAWSTHGVVDLARGVAVAEICHRILARYRGVWSLAWRFLVGTAAVILCYAWAISRGNWQFAILNMDRGLELAIATVIVFLLLFALYYEVSVEPFIQTLAVGFFLFSCFRVLNDTILERWLAPYATLWNFLGTLSFLASLLLWNWAFRQAQATTIFEPRLVSESSYRALAPVINGRLRRLNEQLSHWGRVEGKKT